LNEDIGFPDEILEKDLVRWPFQVKNDARLLRL